MWLIKNNSGQIFFLLPGKRNTVGRKDTDLVLTNDQSVSRKHAIVGAEFSIMGNSKTWTVTVHDLKSKYGSFIKNGDAETDWIVLEPNVDHTVRMPQLNGAQIRFGLLENKWMFVYDPIITTTSNMSTDLKSILKECLNKLGGSVVSAWKETCTHLTMCQITLTVKVVCAMACGRPIVTPNYWKRYLEIVSANDLSPLPDCNDYIPPLAETTIKKSDVSFAVNEKRKTLFVGRCFVFASKEKLTEQGSMITFAGGKALAFNTCGFTLDELCEPHVCVVSYFCNESQESQSLMSFFEILKHLDTRGRRPIPDSEIGLAILHCCTDRYCNPEYDIASSLLRNSSSSQSQMSRTRLDMTSQILAYETQESQLKRKHPTGHNMIIPESGSSTKSNRNDETFDFSLTNPSTSRNNNSSVVVPSGNHNKGLPDKSVRKTNRKRIADEEPEDEPVFKKPISETNSLFTLDTSARNENIDEEDFEFPSDRSVRKRSRSDDEADNPFEFPNKPQTRSRQRKRPMRADETIDEDLFGTSSAGLSRSRSPRRRQPVRVDETIDEDLFGTSSVGLSRSRPVEVTDDGDLDMFAGDDLPVSTTRGITAGNQTAGVTAVPSEASTSKSSTRRLTKSSPTKRKLLSNGQVLKEEPLDKRPSVSVNSTTANTSTERQSKTSVSLLGFLNTSCIKKDEDECDGMDELADSVQDLVLIVEKPLIRHKDRTLPPPPWSSNDSRGGVALNFKVFRKVAHLSNRILPRIIGGSDLLPHVGDAADNWDKTLNGTRDEDMDDPSDEEESNDWDFPAAMARRQKKATPRGR